MTNTSQFSQSLREQINTFVHRSMRASARFVKSSGFSMPQFFLLMYLRHHDHCSISDLSEHMEITNAAASQLVDKLVQAELLVRTEDPDDRRAKKVELSPKGKELIESGIAERYRWVEQLEANLSKEEKEKISEALTIVNRSMEKSQ